VFHHIFNLAPICIALPLTKSLSIFSHGNRDPKMITERYPFNTSIGLKPSGARSKFLESAMPTTLAPTSILYYFSVFKLKQHKSSTLTNTI